MQTNLKRLQVETTRLTKALPPGVQRCIFNKLDDWDVIIDGPQDSVWEKGRFKLHIVFPPNYPFTAPKIFFCHKVFHPNISHKDGSVCVDILSKNWSPATTMDKILLMVISLLTDPNPDDPLNHEASDMFMNDTNKYNKTVKEYILRYNMSSESDISTIDKKVIEEVD